MSTSIPPEVNKFLEKTPGSKKLFEEASRYFPGGVNSAIQFFKPYPVYIAKGYGSKVWDIDGNEYIDFCMAYGAMTAGHRNPAIIEAIRKQVEEKGTLLGAPTPEALSLAKELRKRIPVLEMLRFTNSGGEATMYAVRLARAVTKRDKVIKMEGAYHGAHDYLLISDKPRKYALMGSQHVPASIPDSEGTPEAVAKLTLVAHFNDLDCIEYLLKKHENEIAAIVTEPIQTNSGVILPEVGYLKELRRLADYYAVLLIFDEVKTGFNAAPSVAYQLYGVEPDLITLGKVVGGGTPLAAFGGKEEYMEEITPVGRVVHYGTYNANPLSAAAGLACITKVFTEDTHRRMTKLSAKLAKGLKEVAQDAGLTVAITQVGNMGSIYFKLDKAPRNFREAYRTDKKLWYRWWLGMLAEGIIPYGGAWFEEWFISAMHTEEDVEKYIEISGELFRRFAKH